MLSRANIILPSSLRELHENYEVVENKARALIVCVCVCVCVCVHGWV